MICYGTFQQILHVFSSVEEFTMEQRKSYHFHVKFLLEEMMLKMKTL